VATNATQRETIAQNIMKSGQAVVCIANPRGESVDAILIKPANCHAPANTSDVVSWFELTGDAANSAYLP